MRKIEEQMLTAIEEGKTFSKSNTTVTHTQQGGFEVALHGNVIAKGRKGKVLEVSDAGWPTVTTRSRLRALGANVCQRDWQQYLNGKEWSGEWKEI